jgi:hypothetical protein
MTLAPPRPEWDLDDTGADETDDDDREFVDPPAVPLPPNPETDCHVLPNLSH